jgi:hypothetical protein
MLCDDLGYRITQAVTYFFTPEEKEEYWKLHESDKEWKSQNQMRDDSPYREQLYSYYSKIIKILHKRGYNDILVVQMEAYHRKDNSAYEEAMRKKSERKYNFLELREPPKKHRFKETRGRHKKEPTKIEEVQKEEEPKSEDIQKMADWFDSL